MSEVERQLGPLPNKLIDFHRGDRCIPVPGVEASVIVVESAGGGRQKLLNRDRGRIESRGGNHVVGEGIRDSSPVGSSPAGQWIVDFVGEYRPAQSVGGNRGSRNAQRWIEIGPAVRRDRAEVALLI